MKNTPIVFASDANFMEQLRTASFSAVYACRDSGPGLDIHILDCGIGNDEWNTYELGISDFAASIDVSVKVFRHVVDMTRFSNCPTWTNGSRAAWARLILPDLLETEACCVYSDCDMLFVANPGAILDSLQQSKSWLVGHLNPFGRLVADARWFNEQKLPYCPEKYLCSGLLGIDLDALRRNDFVKGAFAFIARYPHLNTLDQTILNSFCFGRTALLEDGWGSFPHESMSYDGELKALHYTGGYPWSRVKNAYDWVCRHCSRKETELYNAFRVQVMRANPMIAPKPALKDALVGCVLLTLTRLLNRFGIPFPGHPCFSELVAQYDGKGSSLPKAMERLGLAAKT